MNKLIQRDFPDRSGFERHVGRMAIGCFFQSENNADMGANILDLTKLLTNANSVALANSDHSPDLAIVMQMMNTFLNKLATDPEGKGHKVTEGLRKLLEALDKIHSLYYGKMPDRTQDQLDKIGEIALSAIQNMKP